MLPAMVMYTLEKMGSTATVKTSRTPVINSSSTIG